MAFALIPSVGFADLHIVESDTIQITQSADTKDSLSNTASVTLDGDVTSIMAVGGSGNIAQAGDGNSAAFVVDGSYNTIYFAQIGNSVVTMNIAGDQNTVTLNEFGGNEGRSATLDLIMSGDGNDLEIGSSEMYAVASLLDIDLTNSNYAIVKVTYSDYSTIVADIMGDGSDVTINQNSGGSYGASEYFKNSVQLFVDGVTDRNYVYINQYGNGNNVVASVVGGGNTVNVFQDNYDYMMMMQESNQTRVDVNGDGNSVSITSYNDMMYDPYYYEMMMYDPYYYEMMNYKFAEVSVVGNDNTVDARAIDYLNVSVAGSFNNVYSYSSESNIIVTGSGNEVTHNYNSDMMYMYDMMYMDPYYYNEMGRSSASTNINGDANNVNLSFDSYGVSMGSSVDINGSFNDLEFSFYDDYDDNYEMYGLGYRNIDATVSGDGNSLVSTGYVNSGSGIESGEYLTFDIDGNDNDISFGAIQTVGLDVDVTGDANSLNFHNTDNIYAIIYGDANSMSVTDSSSSNNMLYNISGSDNSVNVSNSFTTLLNVGIIGNYNDVDVSGVDELDLNISIAGSGNSYKQEMDDLYVDNSFSYTVNAEIIGDYNSIIVSSVPEYAYSSLDLNIGGYSNALTVTGIGSDYLADASSMLVEIYGDDNTVDLLAGTSAELSVVGSEYSMNLNYDIDLGTYVNTITNVGDDNVTVTTADGQVSVDAI